MTKGTFGEHLRREREMRGVSLNEISGATRIAVRFLEAIEAEQWEQLPGGVFNRGFVRAVSHYLGLDEENMVAEYGLAAGVNPSVPVWRGSPPAVAPDRPWLVWILATAALLLLIAGGWLAVHRIRASRAARRSPQINVNGVPLDAQQPPQLSVGAADPASASPDSPAATTPNSGTPESHDAGVLASRAPPAISPEPASASRPVPAPPIELKIESGKTTRVTVEADTHRVFGGKMKAGEGHRFTAQEQFRVSARDAGALVLELNGQPLAPIGPPGRAGKVTLTREALKGAAGGGN